MNVMTEEMAQSLRARAIHIENLSSLSSVHLGWLPTITCHSNQRQGI